MECGCSPLDFGLIAIIFIIINDDSRIGNINRNNSRNHNGNIINQNSTDTNALPPSSILFNKISAPPVKSCSGTNLSISDGRIRLIYKDGKITYLAE